MDLITTGQAPTMTSLELVEFINSQRDENEAELRHDHFMAKVPKVIGEGAPKFRDTYVNGQNGQTYPCYRFPKREACLMAMSYSYELQAKVYDRMTALEAAAAPAFQIPTTLSGALMLAAQQAQQIEAQAAQLEAAAPAVQFVERFVEAKSSKCLSDVAKLLGWKPQAFIAKLNADTVIFKRGGSWLPFQAHIDAGRFSVKAGESSGHAYQQTRVEPAGITWLASRYPAPVKA